MNFKTIFIPGDLPLSGTYIKELKVNGVVAWLAPSVTLKDITLSVNSGGTGLLEFRLLDSNGLVISKKGLSETEADLVGITILNAAGINYFYELDVTTIGNLGGFVTIYIDANNLLDGTSLMLDLAGFESLGYSSGSSYSVSYSLPDEDNPEDTINYLTIEPGKYIYLI